MDSSRRGGGKVTFFQFADGPYALKKGLQRFNQDNNVVLQNTLKPSITKHFLGIHLFKDSCITESVKIIGLLSALKFRSISVSSDEPVCMATMLGLDTQEISKASPDERMLLLWTMIKEIPAKIIFLSCKKLNVDGYRWAPRSFSR